MFDQKTSEPGNIDVLSIEAPAKVNLCLRVIGERQDGYHDIESIICPVSLTDRLSASIRHDGKINLEVDCDDIPGSDLFCMISNDDNLVARAGRMLQKAAGSCIGADIRLQKRIPVGGGMGGGSSDAAAALIILNELWDQGLEKDELIMLGAALGCDVPAMLHGGPVLAEGAGEKVRAVDDDYANNFRQLHLVLANPGFPVSTRDIYTRYNRSLTRKHGEVNMLTSALVNGKITDLLWNDLQETVFRKYPLIEMMADNLRKAGAEDVLLSGSGATVFGLAANEEHARQVEKELTKNSGFPLWTEVVQTLPDGVMVAHGPLKARV